MQSYITLSVGHGVILFVACAVVVADHQPCYAMDGRLSPDHIVPCHPEQAISTCCSKNGDYCADNGLCLDAVGDNIWSMQGCTTYPWEPPCPQSCLDRPDLIVSPNLNIFLFMCRHGKIFDNSKFCCGWDSSCCTDEDNIFTVPLAHNLTRAGAPLSSGESDSGYTESDKINLGVGIGFGFASLAVAVFTIGFKIWGRGKKGRRTGFQKKAGTEDEYGDDPIPLSPVPHRRNSESTIDDQTSEIDIGIQEELVDLA